MQRKNWIRGLQINGIWTEQPDEIKEEATAHFENRCGMQSTSIWKKRNEGIFTEKSSTTSQWLYGSNALISMDIEPLEALQNYVDWMASESFASRLKLLLDVPFYTESCLLVNVSFFLPVSQALYSSSQWELTVTGDWLGNPLEETRPGTESG